jgi:hypothetical protein
MCENFTMQFGENLYWVTHVTSERSIADYVKRMFMFPFPVLTYSHILARQNTESAVWFPVSYYEQLRRRWYISTEQPPLGGECGATSEICRFQGHSVHHDKIWSGLTFRTDETGSDPLNYGATKQRFFFHDNKNWRGLLTYITSSHFVQQNDLRRIWYGNHTR